MKEDKTLASRRFTIDTEPQRCTGCRRCQLICSLRHSGRFNPDKSRISIAEVDQGVDSISFTDDCDLCGICVSYCVYGALWHRREG